MAGDGFTRRELFYLAGSGAIGAALYATTFDVAGFLSPGQVRAVPAAAGLSDPAHQMMSAGFANTVPNAADPAFSYKGKDIRISELAELVAKVTGFKGNISLDTSKPDGTLRKRLDVSRLSELGWTAKIPLEDGIADTYRWFLEHYQELRSV